MAGQNYYLITALPPLDELGSAAPLTNRQMLEHLADSGGPYEAVAAMLLGDDLLQREALLAGEITKADPVVLTSAQLSNEEPLPEYLTPAKGPTAARRIAADALWEAYYRHAASVAHSAANAFLGEWIAYEVALRNALAARRAQTLELEASDYLVATDLAADDQDFTAVLNRWASAPNPLAGMQTLDRARWEWLTGRDRWFSFADDELTAYAAKLMLLRRWYRLAERMEQQPAAQEAD